MADRHFDRARSGHFLLLAALVAFPLTALGGWPEGGADRNVRFRVGPGVANHPVNVIPSAAVSISPGWPLGIDGTIACTTCHSALPRLDGKAGAQLRGGPGSADPKAFCMNCHREEGVRTAAGTHWMAVSKAHVMKTDDKESLSRHGGVDRDSRTCLSCHDGVSAPDAGYETSQTRNRGFLGDKSRNHPIGVPYPRGGTRGVEVPLRPASLLPESISLPGGYVSCNSCHNLYNLEPNRLSVPIEGSRLCMTCHDMD